ncbi:MAG: CPBP family glutamic-type intramembrane protease [Gemmatimonadota bacterium]|nr:CPBP family glutamic-type intramembrane protease [Gemmatimonadota bacterium]
MTSRELFQLPDGTLRAPWRLLGFFVIGTMCATVLGSASAVFARSKPGAAVSSWIFLVSLLVAHAVMLRAVDRLPWTVVGLARDQARPRYVAGGWLIGALAIGVPSVVLLGTGLLDVYRMPGGAADWWRWAASMALFLLPAALWEELVFRGYPFVVLRKAIGLPGALGLTSVLFGLAHVGNRPGSLLPLVLVVLAGFFLAAVLLATQSLWAAWMAHFAWNWVMAALLHTDVSGFLPAPPPAYRVADAGPDWVTGGAWGPEGGVAAGLGMTAGLAYLFARWRCRGGE